MTKRDNKKYYDAATKAALAERLKYFDRAHSLWLVASEVSTLSINRLWAQRRSEYCESIFVI